MTDRELNQQIARTVWQQIPVLIKMACGAREAQTIENGLRFRVNHGRVNQWIEVRLNGRDLYDITHFRVKRGSYERETLNTSGDVYAEDLGEVLYHMVNR